MARSQCIFGETKEPQGRLGLACRPHWEALLPDAWRGEAVAPSSFRVHREHEMPARQVFGLGPDGTTCFYAYDYRLVELRSDDDEELYGALAYADSLRAWRLHDGRWLVHRWLQPFGEDGEPVACWRLDERMPR
jgi:hypothetical protein